MKQAERYKELDALRGVAALMVVFFHFIWGRPYDTSLNFNIGNMGVELFFIISGFVIFMSLNKINNGKEFIINRFCRLYPTYWASLTLTFILINIYYHYTIIDFPKLHLNDFLGNLTMFQFYLGFPNIDGSYWTLTIELLFYIFMFLIFKLGLLKYINYIGATLSLILVVLCNLMWNESVQNIFKWVPLFTYFPLFFAGILFYKMYNSGSKKKQNSILAIFCFISQVLLFKATGRSIFFGSQSYAVTLSVFMILFFVLAWHKLNFLAIKPLLFVGKISFALYLIHTFISINLLFPYFVDTLKINYWLSAIFIILPILLVIASLITYFIEIPLQAVLKRKLKQIFKLAANQP